MNDKAATTFVIQSWDEKPVDEQGAGASAQKLSHARIVKRYEGALVGEGVVEQVAAYRSDGSGVFSAVERFRGTLDGREGTLVFQHIGTFLPDSVLDEWTIVPGTGTGALEGITGRATFESGHAEKYPLELEFVLD